MRNYSELNVGVGSLETENWNKFQQSTWFKWDPREYFEELYSKSGLVVSCLFQLFYEYNINFDWAENVLCFSYSLEQQRQKIKDNYQHIFQTGPIMKNIFEVI